MKYFTHTGQAQTVKYTETLKRVVMKHWNERSSLLTTNTRPDPRSSDLDKAITFLQTERSRFGSAPTQSYLRTMTVIWVATAMLAV